jgi:hypothetical protein
MQKQIPGRIVEFVEPYIGQGTVWRKRFLGFIQKSELAIDRQFFEFFLRLIQEGLFDMEL